MTAPAKVSAESVMARIVALNESPKLGVLVELHLLTKPASNMYSRLRVSRNGITHSNSPKNRIDVLVPLSERTEEVRELVEGNMILLGELEWVEWLIANR